MFHSFDPLFSRRVAPFQRARVMARALMRSARVIR
jgi:hypothetical protein